MSGQARDAVTRRGFLGLGPLAVGASVMAAPETEAADAGAGATVLVALDGSGDFGPETQGTKTSGIQEAIDAVHGLGGGTVHLRRGVYLVDDVMPPPEDAGRFDCGLQSLGIYDDITLRGEGIDQTVIRTAAECNSNAILGWQTSRVCIQDLTLDGAGLNAGYGIAIFGMGVSFSDVRLTRVKAINFGVSAIAVAGGERAALEHCVGANSKTAFEMGSPSKDYWVLHCTAYGCSNSTLIFNPADKYNEAGNLHPHVIGGRYDGEGVATGLAMWDCWEPMVIGVTAVGGVTTNIQVSESHRETIATPVGGGLIDACVAEAGVGSWAGKYGIGACQDGLRVSNCSVVGNEDVGVLVSPAAGEQVSVTGCTFRPGPEGRQQYAVAVRGEGVRLNAAGNLHEGPRERFLTGAEALDISGSAVTGNLGFNPTGLLPSPDVPESGAFTTSNHPYPVEVCIQSGSVAAIGKRDVSGNEAAIAASASSTVLQPGEAIRVEYGERPEWSWWGL